MAADRLPERAVVETRRSAAQRAPRREGHRHGRCRQMPTTTLVETPAPRGTNRQPAHGICRPRGIARTDSKAHSPTLRHRPGRNAMTDTTQHFATLANQPSHQAEQFAEEREHPGSFTQPNIRQEHVSKPRTRPAFNKPFNSEPQTTRRSPGVVVLTKTSRRIGGHGNT